MWDVASYDTNGVRSMHFVKQVRSNGRVTGIPIFRVFLGHAFAIRDSIQQANRRTILVQCIP
jgi:hypothetical protein